MTFGGVQGAKVLQIIFFLVQRVPLVTLSRFNTEFGSIGQELKELRGLQAHTVLRSAYPQLQAQPHGVAAD